MNATGVFWDEVREYWVVEFDYRPDRQEQYRTQAAAVKRAAELGWRGDVPVSELSDIFNTLVRKAEPWSTYTEGYNDALDAAEQAILAARWTSPRDHRMERIIEAMGTDDDE